MRVKEELWFRSTKGVIDPRTFEKWRLGEGKTPTPSAVSSVLQKLYPEIKANAIHVISRFKQSYPNCEPHFENIMAFCDWALQFVERQKNEERRRDALTTSPPQSTLDPSSLNFLRDSLSALINFPELTDLLHSIARKLERGDLPPHQQWGLKFLHTCLKRRYEADQKLRNLAKESLHSLSTDQDFCMCSVPLGAFDRRAAAIDALSHANGQVLATSIAENDWVFDEEYLEANLKVKKDNPDLQFQRLIIMDTFEQWLFSNAPNAGDPAKADKIRFQEYVKAQVDDEIQIDLICVDKNELRKIAKYASSSWGDLPEFFNMLIVDDHYMTKSFDGKGGEGEIISNPHQIGNFSRNFKTIWKNLQAANRSQNLHVKTGKEFLALYPQVAI